MVSDRVYMIAAGIVGGLVAALFGFIDFLAIPADTRARGELVDRLGVVVSDGANLNAPSSLSGHPAG